MKQETLLFLEKLEEYLIKSNIHTAIVEDIMNFLVHKIIQNDNLTKEEIINLVHTQIKLMMNKYIAEFDIEHTRKPYVMIVCGINGAGKTTTIGKMYNLLKNYGWEILIAGCDTYRAGATEQLQTWIKDKQNDFISGKTANENASDIAIRAYNQAEETNKDVLIIDTSGRLQNNQNLMAELLKMKHKLNEISSKIPNDVVLIIDSNCGYNALEQAQIYNDLIGITGIIATKIDISKRPGVILSICKQFNIKIFGVCDGENNENINDLDTQSFADAILCDVNKIM